MALALDRIAFSIGSLSVTWYGIILASAALAGLFLAIREGKRFGIIPDFFMDLLLIGVPSAIVGARLYYVAFTWSEYRNNLIDIFKTWQGGIAIYGALIGAFIGAYFYIKKKGYTFLRIADICAPGLIIGQLIGRWGNFINQEAYGGPVDESFLRSTLHLPKFIVDNMFIMGEYHHPTFLYESLWNLLGLLLLLWLRRRPFLRSGELLISYLMWYSLGRFFIEALRTDSLMFAGPKWLEGLMDGLWSPMSLLFDQGATEIGKNIRVSQLLAVLLILGGIILIIYRRKSGAASAKYLDPIISTRAAAATEGPAGAASPAVAAGTLPVVDAVVYPLESTTPETAGDPEEENNEEAGEPDEGEWNEEARPVAEQGTAEEPAVDTAPDSTPDSTPDSSSNNES